MLMRFDPWREFERMTSQMLGDTRVRSLSMPMDAYRHEDHLVIHFDLPGVDPESVDLTVEKNVLTVSARRTIDRGDVEEIVVSERPQGLFSRQIFLGDGLDHDRVEASYEHGVLSIRVPVLETAKPRRVPITVGEEQQAIETSAS